MGPSYFWGSDPSWPPLISHTEYNYQWIHLPLYGEFLVRRIAWSSLYSENWWRHISSTPWGLRCPRMHEVDSLNWYHNSGSKTICTAWVRTLWVPSMLFYWSLDSRRVNRDIKTAVAWSQKCNPRIFIHQVITGSNYLLNRLLCIYSQTIYHSTSYYIH